jgi:hypothetical protein
MAQQANVNIDISSKADTRGFKVAETALSKLNKSVKSLAGTLGIAYGTRAIANFGVASVKAFAADDKAARVLTKSLDNLGLSFSSIQVKNFIGDLEKTYAVLDDQLRPAFQRLLTTTGSVAQAQNILVTALNLSAATGVDVVSVSEDLSKAFVGQTRGLAKYGLGLSQAQLKAMSFLDLQKKIDSTFTGQAALAADTYSGSLSRLAIASNNAKEAIGKGLVEALAALGGPNGLQGTIGFIDKASTSLETFIRRLGVGVAQAKALLSGDLKGFAAIGQAEANRGKTPSGITPSIAAELKKAAIEKAAAKRAKEQAALTAKNTKAVAGLTALQKANGLFELDQIQLVAALKGKLSDEDRTRAELQLAILQGNTAEASKLAAEVAKAQGLTASLVAYYSGLPNASNPFLGWIETLKQAAILAQQIASANYGVTTPSYNGAAIDTILSGYGSMPSPAAAGVSATGDVNVYVAGSVVSEGDLVELVRDGLLNRSLSGSPSAIGRLKGSFAG